MTMNDVRRHLDLEKLHLSVGSHVPPADEEQLEKALSWLPSTRLPAVAHGYTRHHHLCCNEAPSRTSGPTPIQCGAMVGCRECRIDAHTIHTGWNAPNEPEEVQ